MSPRTDKHVVSGGDSSVYAPPNPIWSEWPGFWDEVHLGRQAVPRLFTLLLLDDDGKHVPLRFVSREWEPHVLRQVYTAGDWEYGEGELYVVEERVNLNPDVFVSRFSIRNMAPRDRDLHAVQWGWQPLAPDGTSVVAPEVVGGTLRFELRLPREEQCDRHPDLSLFVNLGADRPAASWVIQLADPHGPGPEYRFSPCREKFRHGRFPDTAQVDVGPMQTREGPRPPTGSLHYALHFPLRLPTGADVRLSLGASLGFTPGRASAGRSVIALGSTEQSAASWDAYYASVPTFDCSDLYLRNFYRYRWYQLRAHQVKMGFGGFQSPCVLEGIGPFRQHISYSAHCHMRECRWMHDPAFARGSLENMLASQRSDGFFPGHINERGVAGVAGSITGKVSFYHANWGNAWGVHQVHPDPEFLARAYEGLALYADAFERERDPEGCGLYDVVNQGETGQEYMPRYQAVDPYADDWGAFRLKGVDATFYTYELCRALAKMAVELGRPDSDAERWTRHADRIRHVLRTLAWDPDLSLFCDVDPVEMRRTRVMSAVCFYPFMSDIATAVHLPAIRRHLLDPAQFWTPWPFPSTGLGDPMFSAEAEWKGKRTNCPWNGRVWPMTNSHLCEALAEAAIHLDPSLKPQAVTAIRRFVELMFTDQDPNRPNTWEHYNPLTGAPCDYRGVDDYQHSWVNDLIFRYVCGIRPCDGNEVVIDPLPFEVSFSVEEVPMKGHRLSVSYSPSDGMCVSVDNTPRHHSPNLERTTLQL